MTEENNQLVDINKLVVNPVDVEKVIEGSKTATRRNDRYATIGDKLVLNGYGFVMTNVYKQKLGQVSEKNAKEEGYHDLDAYKKAITSIHRGMEWDPNMEVWVHEFAPAN